MGFTVPGPGRFLASGHPDLRDDELVVEGKPALLGLVESSDGLEWESVSLLGEADFHALEFVQGTIYGWFDDRFWVSANGEDWEQRSKVAIHDFAVDPADGDTVVASTEDGLTHSDDGGRSWRRIGTEPYTVLSWEAGTLFGASPDGTVAASQDDGATWQRRGALKGLVEALLATDDTVFAAVSGEGIFRSDNGGATWHHVVATGEGDH
ncbi:MAG: glycosyl hydrolase [Nitriliruptorales bacterium]|nr:glycosyl hydrolase [Nitriliruptorales bacterium]